MSETIIDPATDPVAARIAGDRVLAQVGDLPGGRELLELTCQREDVALVGGAVRDLLRDGTSAPRELDVVVAGDAALLASRLAALLGGEATVHGRFGTALVRGREGSGARIDVATRRAESYASLGALPTVSEGTLEDDLRRRDFTVNTIMVWLGGANRGRLGAVEGAFVDLRDRRLRVLHETSFLEDPTRVMRLARYRARLGFEVEAQTARLAGEAVSTGALTRISGARLGAELRLALAEPDALGAIDALAEIGVLGALHPRLRWERSVVDHALALLGDEEHSDRARSDRPDLLALATIVLALTMRADGSPRGDEAAALLNRLQFSASDRDRTVAAAVAVPRLIADLPTAGSGSALREAVASAPAEGVALAGAIMGGQGVVAVEGIDAVEGIVAVEGIDVGEVDPRRHRGYEAARRWLGDLRHRRLKITGDDLIAAGVPAGPEVGRGLDRALRKRLDGQLPDDRESELRGAIE